jgi:hypothetical protein
MFFGTCMMHLILNPSHPNWLKFCQRTVQVEGPNEDRSGTIGRPLPAAHMYVTSCASTLEW